MAMDYNDWFRKKDLTIRELMALEEEEKLKWESYVEPPFDESVLTPEQRVMLDEESKENPTMERSDLAIMIRLNLLDHRAALEGRDLTFSEIYMAQMLKEVIYWVPPTQLKGTCDSTFEIHDFEDHMPFTEDVACSLHTPLLIDECYDLISESQRMNDLRVEKLAKDYHDICFDIHYLCALSDHDPEFSFSMNEPSRSLPEMSYLEDVLDVDKILNEIKDSEVEMDSRDENIVFYMIDGDEVDYFFLDSFKPVVDFVFPPNAFVPHEPPLIKEYLKIYAMLVVIFFDENCVCLLWKTMFSSAHIVSCPDRRRTKGALAQPFDSCD